MQSFISDSILEAFNKCNFILEKKLIGNSTFINENIKIINDLLKRPSNSRGLLLHQGTNLPLYLTIILATFHSFLSDESDNDAFLDELEIGDLVIYEDKRGRFEGFDSEERVIVRTIDRKNPCVNYIPRAVAYKLKPYRGNAKTLDGRGLKRGSITRNKFVASLFDIEINEVKNSLKKSIIVVCNRQVADKFIERLNISISNDNHYVFGEMFPTAFYTPNDIVYYTGNSARIEPIIKFTNKLSVARELILEDRNIVSLIVNGSDYITAESSELENLYTRRSVENILMLGELYSGNYSNVSRYENLEMCIWTENTIKENITDINRDYTWYANESKCLYERLNNFTSKEFMIIDIESELENEIYIECKKALFRISQNISDYGDEKTFVIRGFSLLNLFERSCFPISVMEKLISEGQINAFSPSQELYNLERINMDYYGNEDMNIVCSILSEMKDALYNGNPKFNYLKKFIEDGAYKKVKKAIIVPKSYYYQICMESLPEELGELMYDFDVVTTKKFDSSVIYDEVLIVGMFQWETLNPMALSNTKFVKMYCYNNEMILYSQALKKYHNEIAFYEKCNIIKTRNEIKLNIPSTTNTDEPDNYYDADIELNNFTRHFAISSTLSALKAIETDISQYGQIVDIAKVAILETGEYVFFTKHYTPYVFDAEKQDVSESDVNSLGVGDLIIFTTYDNETRDIVEKIIEKLLESNKCDEIFKESYRKLIHWKQTLKNYITVNCLTYKELSQKMHDIGKGKHEVTLRTWLDSESHIVGPRDSDSFYAIALITNDEEMLYDPESFCEACRNIRSMRVRILKFIGNSIINAYNNKDDEPDELFSFISEDIIKMSSLAQIEKIIDANDLTVPIHMSNKPQIF